MSSQVSKVTSDDTNPVQLYLLKELADLTMKTTKDSDTVRSALLNRLAKTSPDVKLKALRTIKYICQNGRIEFKMGFQREPQPIKSLLSFQCPPDDLRGDKPAENVRAEAQECLEAIFADHTSSQQNVKVEAFGNQLHYNQSQGPMAMSGGGQYGGFGSGPAPQRKQQDESITGFNIRKTLSDAILGPGSINNGQGNRPYVPTASSNSSQYGGMGSNQYQSSSYSHYTHSPHQQQQQQQQQSSQHHQQPQHQQSSTPGYSQNGLYGGGGSAQSYDAARNHGYNTYSQHQQQQSTSSASNAGVPGKSGPWGSQAPTQPHSSQPQPQHHTPQQHQHQPQQQNHQQQQQGYVSRSGPSTKGSVEELGFEKRIVAQFTTNTPLKPHLNEVELKKFTQDCSSCAIDDILTILHETFANPSTPAISVTKALQIFQHIVVSCGMVSQECDREHLDTIQQLHATATNKHVKSGAEKILVGFGLAQSEDPVATVHSNAGVTGFVSPLPAQQHQQPQQPQEQNDPFGIFSTSTQQPQNRQPTPAKTSGMFGGMNLKPKATPSSQTQAQQSAFDFMDTPAPPPAAATAAATATATTTTTAPSNDIFALLGNDTVGPNKASGGGLDLDALYANTTPVQHHQPQQQFQPPPPQQPTTSASAFDFMDSTPRPNGGDDIFADLMRPAAPAPVHQPPPQQQAKKPDMSSFDFVDSLI